MSLWWLRPLREDQLVYAGLDAYCVLEIRAYVEKQIGPEEFQRVIERCRM